MMKCGIYKITNKVNGKMYIGQSVDIEKRWREHKSASKTQDSHLYIAIRKYGFDNFIFSIICEVPESALDQYEISYIKYYETTNPEKGYNKTFGGEGGKHSEETKKKISESNKGKTCSEESKQKMSDAKKGENNHNFGKTHSDETKQKMSESQKGKKMSEESKKKISKSKKGSKYSLKQYLYKGNVYNGMRELADFLGIKYKTLAARIRSKRIDVTIIGKGSI